MWLLLLADCDVDSFGSQTLGNFRAEAKKKKITLTLCLLYQPFMWLIDSVRVASLSACEDSKVLWLWLGTDFSSISFPFCLHNDKTSLCCFLLRFPSEISVCAHIASSSQVQTEGEGDARRGEKGELQKRGWKSYRENKTSFLEYLTGKLSQSWRFCSLTHIKSYCISNTSSTDTIIYQPITLEGWATKTSHQ